MLAAMAERNAPIVTATHPDVAEKRGGLQSTKPWLGRLDDRGVALPAFVFDLDALNQYGVGIGVEVGLSLELRNPAAKNAVGDRELAGFVEGFDDDVLAEVIERGLGPKAGADVPDFVRSLLELGVESDAPLEGDGFIFGAAGRFAAAAWIAAFAVLHDFGGALERADFADARDVAAVPLDAKFEVLVGIKSLSVDA